MTDFILSPFQDAGATRLERERRHFLLFTMGLGKTVVSTKALWTVQQEMILIVCPKNAIRVWEDHIKDWFAGLDALSGRTTPYFIHRWRKKYNDARKRREVFSKRVPNAVNVYIMTYNGFISDDDHITHTFNAIILDEAKRIRGHKSKAFERLKKRAKLAQYFWPGTGTPGRLPMHFWTMFHLADPKLFGSYWKFVSMFHIMMKNEWGRPEILGVRNQDAWYRLLKSKASIVTKDMVKGQIGNSAMKRQRLYVEMDELQEKHYKELLQDMMTMTEDQLIIAGTSLTRTLRLRQLLVCPKILGSPSYGAALEDLIETLGDTDPHVVIFTPFVQSFPFIKERLVAAGYSNVFTLSGNVTPDEQFDLIEQYRKTRGIMICSILYAQAFSLEPATEAFFLGHEYNPEDNAQAEQRLQRFTTDYNVNIYYYTYENTYDDEQVDINNTKQRHINWTLDPTMVGLKF
jgi:SNF2 family DNA or RNA helicase